MAAPTLLLAAYDPGSLHVQWMLPGAPPANLTGFRVSITGGGDFSHTQDATSTQMQMTVAITLGEADAPYSLTVETLLDGAPGEASAPVNLIIAPLTLLSIIYDLSPDKLSVQWTPPHAPATGGLATLRDGMSLKNQTGTTGAVFDTSLTGDGSAYSVAVRPIADDGIVQGPASQVYQPIALPLTLLVIVYDLSPDKLSVQWTPPHAPATGGLATLSDGMSLKSQTGTTGAAFNTSLSGDGSAYSVAVRPIADGGLVQGPASQAYQPIALPLTLLSIVYDLSPDKLSVQWTPPHAPATGGLATLSDGMSVKSQTGTSGAVFDTSLTGDGTAYSVSVRATANDGIVQGPASQVYEPITTPLSLTVIAYDLVPAGQLAVEWVPPGLPATGGLATLSGNGGVRNLTGSVSATFDGDLTGDGSAYDVTTRAISNGGIVQGPATPAHHPITTPLSLISLIYDLGPDTLTVQWAPPAAPATRGMATLVGPSTLRYGEGPTGTAFAITLQSGDPYQVTFRPTDDNAIVYGPVSPSFQPIADRITLNFITYDVLPAPALSVGWGSLSPAASEGLATLSNGGSVQSLTGTDGVIFDGTVLETDTVTARQTSDDGRIQGPASPVYNPITATTAMTLAAYDLNPGTLQAQWQPGTGESIAYLAILTTTGEAPVTAATAGTETVFTGDLPTDEPTDIAVRITDADGLVRGPASAAIAVYKTQITGSRLAYLTSGKFRAAWTELGDVDGYLYRFDVGGVPGTPVEAPDSGVEIDQAIAAGTSYGLRVRGKSGLAQGPWSDPAPGPYLLSAVAGYDALSRLTTFDAAGYGAFGYERDAFGNIRTVRFIVASGGGEG